MRDGIAKNTSRVWDPEKAVGGEVQPSSPKTRREREEKRKRGERREEKRREKRTHARAERRGGEARARRRRRRRRRESRRGRRSAPISVRLSIFTFRPRVMYVLRFRRRFALLERGRIRNLFIYLFFLGWGSGGASH